MAIIYKITNKQNGKVYIGQTKVTLEWRLTNNLHGHFKRAFKDNDDNYFHAALRKYGKDNFDYSIIEEIDNHKFNSKKEINAWLNERERYWIKYFNSNNHEFGYNQTSGGQKDFVVNKKDKHVFRQHVSAAVTELWKNPEYREKQCLAKLGKKRHPDIGKKIAATRRANNSYIVSDNAKELTRQRMQGNTYRKNKILSEETKLAIGKSVTITHSRPETKEKMRQSAVDRVWINNGTINKHVKSNKLEDYLNTGWTKGRITNFGQCNKGTKFVNNGKITKRVKIDELQDYLNAGWALGKHRRCV